MKQFTLFAFLFLLCAHSALAQVNSNDFTIRTLVGGDVLPPTTPTLLTVDPVATTQIDLSWSSSTDNYAVAGYSVVRDGTPIATTTLLSYSDTGLFASTTYSYIVRAFDLAFNYSSSSNSISTTTPDNPPSPPPGSTDTTQEGTVARVVLRDFFIDTGISTSSLNLNTARPARIEVRWGRTVSYELGYVVSNTYTREHSVLLTDLEPGTTYEYEVIGYTTRGVQSIIHTGSFTTLSESQVVSPVNVSRFQAIQNGNDVDLSWQLPVGDSLSHVRVVRSHLGFPEHPHDGAIVYQGLKTAIRDEAVLSQYSPVYYTAFVYDTAGNISSGAVAIVYDTRPPGVGGEVGETVSPGGMVPGTGNPVIDLPVVIEEATTTIITERVTVDMKMPQASEIEVIQSDRKFTLFDTDITLRSEQEFVVSIPSDAVAGNLKSIIVTILDPTNNKTAHSYLLRINRDQTAYEATVPGLQVAGQSQLRVEIYDYEAFVVASYQTPLTFAMMATEVTDEVVFPDMAFKRPYLLWLAIAFPLALFSIWFLVYRRRDEDNNDEE